ncbi:MAG: FCD domain-containing protein [Betaproteobacteria bacterium]
MNSYFPAESGSALRIVQSNSLPALVQQQLERMILTGKFLPGSKLTEIPLAEQLGVSRGPVREAFRILEEKGLVRVEKNRGVYVRTITAQEANEIYEVRAALEELIVKKLVACPEKTKSSGLHELLAKAEKLATQGNVDKCHTCNIEFHDRLAALTGNATLLENYRRLVNELSLFRHHAHASVRDASSLKASVADHQAILAAIVEGQGDLAAQRLLEHVEASRKRTQNFLDEQDDASALHTVRK